MVYKNEYEYLYALAGGIFFGVIMTLRMGVAGVFAGVIFGIIIFLFTLFTSAKVEKSANTLRYEISQVRHVICDGPATYLKDKKTSWYKMPDNVVGVISDPISGNPADDSTKKKKMFYYIKGTEPTEEDPNLDVLVPTIKNDEKNTET